MADSGGWTVVRLNGSGKRKWKRDCHGPYSVAYRMNITAVVELRRNQLRRISPTKPVGAGALPLRFAIRPRAKPRGAQ